MGRSKVAPHQQPSFGELREPKWEFDQKIPVKTQEGLTDRQVIFTMTQLTMKLSRSIKYTVYTVSIMFCFTMK